MQKIRKYRLRPFMKFHPDTPIHKRQKHLMRSNGAGRGVTVNTSLTSPTIDGHLIQRLLGHYPQLASLSNTGEVMSFFNVSANQQIEEIAVAYADQAISKCLRVGFEVVRLRFDSLFGKRNRLYEV